VIQEAHNSRRLRIHKTSMEAQGFSLEADSSLLQFCGCPPTRMSGQTLRPALYVLGPRGLIESKPRLLGHGVLSLALHAAAERHQVSAEVH
jgi:hypothetical protein